MISFRSLLTYTSEAFRWRKDVAVLWTLYDDNQNNQLNGMKVVCLRVDMDIMKWELHVI